MIDSLGQNILGQEIGIRSILSAFSSWEMRKNSGQSSPLVLAIIGPIGVGKSETGNMLRNRETIMRCTLNNISSLNIVGLVVSTRNIFNHLDH